MKFSTHAEHRMQQRRGDARTGASDRVTEGNGAAMHVHYFRVEFAGLDRMHRHDGESFIDFK